MKTFIKYIWVYIRNRKEVKDFRWLHYVFSGCDGKDSACSDCPFLFD